MVMCFKPQQEKQIWPFINQKFIVTCQDAGTMLFSGHFCSFLFLSGEFSHKVFKHTCQRTECDFPSTPFPCKTGRAGHSASATAVWKLVSSSFNSCRKHGANMKVKNWLAAATETHLCISLTAEDWMLWRRQVCFHAGTAGIQLWR